VPAPPLIVIGGATATGKTRLSLDIAEALDAEIVSADSRQVYRGMDIGTAKVSGADRARVPHHGLDLVEPDARFTAADFRRYALTVLADIAARGRPAILVGGTGLYLRAVARGIPMDTTGEDLVVRAELEDRLEREGLPSLLAELHSIAPSAWERVDRANHRRVIRAIERARVEGDAPPRPPEGYPAPVAWLGIAADPGRHAQDIEERARAQFRDGLLDEAAALRERFGEDLRPFGAMGYREAFDVLAGRRTLDAAVFRTSERTRSYASRQRTWFRAEPDIHWLPPGPGSMAAALEVARLVVGV
jgi:tRNA dimethylallyltransferase